MTQVLDLGKLRFNFAGDWVISTLYEINDVVKYGGNVYVYTYALKTAGSVPTNTTYWALMVEGFNFLGNYSNATAYKIGDSIAYGGKVYVCIADNTNVSPTNTGSWSLFADGMQYEGTYDNAVAYQKNDIVKYGNIIYIAKMDTIGNLPTDTSKWDLFVSGVSPSSVYNTGTQYYTNDLVVYGNTIYIAIANSINQNPDTATAYWQLFSNSLRARNAWAATTSYYVNDIITYGGNTYICLITHISSAFATDLAAVKWSKFNSGIRYRGNWTATTAYLKDDVIYDGVSSTYIANNDFTSTSNMLTDTGSANLSLLAKGASVTGIPTMDVSTQRKLLGNYAGTPVWVNNSVYSFNAFLEMRM